MINKKFLIVYCVITSIFAKDAISGTRIFHFDNTVTGENNLSPVTSTGAIRYLTGVSNQGVFLEEGTTNYVFNSNFNSDLSNWTILLSSGPFTRETNVSDGSIVMSTCARFTPANAGDWFYSPDTPANTGVDTLSVYLRGSGIGRIGMVDSAWIWSSNITLTSTWTRYTYSYNKTGNNTQTAIGVGNTSTDIYSTNVQLEEKSYATSYCNGSLGTGYSWSGTAFASTSTRTKTTLSYSNTYINPNKGTIDIYWKPEHDNTFSNDRYIFATDVIKAYFRASDDKFVFETYNGSSWNTLTSASQTFSADSIFRIVFTWNNTTGKSMKINNVTVSDNTAWTSQSITTNLLIGSDISANFQSDAVIDELYILDVDDIRTPYNLKIKPGIESIVLTWQMDNPLNTGYKIYRRTGNSGTYSQIGSVSSTNNTYTDNNLTNGVTYYYKVVADYDGYFSDFSNEASGIPGLFTDTISPDKSYDIETGPIKIGIPANTFMSSVKFEVEPAYAVTSGRDNKKPFVAYSFKITEQETGKIITDLKKPIIIIMKLTSDGIYVKNTYPLISLSEASKRLNLVFWNGLDWVPISSRVSVSDNNLEVYVEGKTAHLSLYGVMIKEASEEIKVTVAPNPFTPLSSDSRFNRVKFSFNNSSNQMVEIKIWDVTARLVKTLTGVTDSLTWDGTDEYGEVCEGGVYIYQIKVGNDVIKRGTIVLAR